MKRPPIPRALLPHSALLHRETTDEWQRPVSAESHELKHIRIDASLSRQADEQNTTDIARWVLFYDCRNSLPCGMHFTPGQVVLWHDRRLTVMHVTPVWADQTLHHYELELEGS